MSNRIRIPVKEFEQGLYDWARGVLEHFDDYPDVHNRVVVAHRRSRKTTLGLNLLLRECVGTRDCTYAYISPFFRQSKAIIWRDPMMLKRYMPPEILRKSFNETELVGEFTSGSVLQVGGADDPDRWRGMGCKGWVLDEFATMKEGAKLYQEIIYPIIRDNGGWVLFLYTPRGRGCGWEFFQKAEHNPNWERWFLPVEKSGILSDEEIAETKKGIPEHLFAQEYGCEFLVGGGGVIKRIEEIIVGVLQKPVIGGRYVMGVDLGKKEDWTVLSVLNCTTRHLDAFERFQQFDWSFQKEKIARLAKEYNNPLIILDSTGLGSPIEDDLKRMGLNVRGFQFTSVSKKQLIEKLILAIEDRRITIPQIDELVNELQDYDIDEKGRYGAPRGLHDDAVTSLALAIQGLGAEIYRSEVREDDYQPFSERFKTEGRTVYA